MYSFQADAFKSNENNSQTSALPSRPKTRCRDEKNLVNSQCENCRPAEAAQMLKMIQRRWIDVCLSLKKIGKNKKKKVPERDKWIRLWLELMKPLFCTQRPNPILQNPSSILLEITQMS